ncbi:MAG: histidinol-phosphate transaminase [Gammaproteobacteria bacterium]|nr:histidinol-phosphate transaminase [Gammaproteobacteria bacterium]
MSKSFRQLAAPGVQQLQPYLPGKPVEELERELGISDSIKLASNENPLGPSPGALQAIEQCYKAINYYPDGSAFKLSQRLAEHYGVDPACLTLGNGSNDVLELVARAFLTSDHTAVYSQYAFAVYPIVVQAIGARANVAPAFSHTHETMPLGHDPEALIDSIDESTRVVFIANPNNPTGTWIGADTVKAMLDRVPPDVIVVLDLAYLEYMDEDLKPDIDDLLAKHSNLIITGTFSKVYALAGLRIGYGLSSADIADLLNRVRQPFNTNLIAQAAALAALDDDAHIQRSVAMNKAGKVYLQQQFDRLGLSYLPSMGNFLTVCFERDAMSIYQALLHQGVIVRPLANYQMPDYLRMTIGTREQNERLIDALTGVSA